MMQRVIGTIFFVAMTLAAVLASAQPAAAQTAMTRPCHGVYQGVPVEGVLVVSRMMTAMRWEIRGYFQDPYRNTYEFEVLTPGAGGTGGLWINSQRHRESHVFVQLLEGGFTLRLEDGQVVPFRCS